MKLHKTNIIGIALMLLFTTVSCEFEPYEPGLGEEVIEQESTLYSYLQLVTEDTNATVLQVGCVEFIYPFVLFVYDTDDVFVRKESILDNQSFAMVLATLEEDYAIGLSYPITGFLQDGSPIEINSNETLEASLQTCIDEQKEIILGACNGIATAKDCVWNVTESSIVDSPYTLADANFKLEDDGSVSFIVDETTYVGTWIFYFIGNDLHMNMFYEYNADNMPDPENDLLPIKEDWNFDWKITYIDDEKIDIENNLDQTYALERVCEAPLTDEEEN